MASSQQDSDQRGAGGKFRREPNRSTPYDRPHRDSGRIRKNVIDPALRLTKTVSQTLFSLMFPNNAPRIASIPEVNQDSRDGFPAVIPSNTPGAQEQVTVESGSLINNSHSSAINDFEQMITQKTFTRDEVDRLIEVLHSKTSDVPDVDEHRRIGSGTSALVEAPPSTRNVQSKKNEMKSQTLHAIGAASLGDLSFLENDVASPAELAKAYMGRSSSKLIPSTMGLHSPVFRQDVSWKTNLPFTPKSNSLLVGRRTSVPYGSIPRRSENGCATPVSRGRSDIYNMARTPYSRAHHPSMSKGVDPMTDCKAGPSTSLQRSWVSGGKQTSKRRSSVLDYGNGSTGPIRRTRQKTNTMFPTGNMGSRSPLPIPLTPIASDAVKGNHRPILSNQKQFQLDESNRRTIVPVLMENEQHSIAGKRSVGVPTQSTEIARRILQQLDKCMPSPKGKSPERKTTTVMEASPSKLTTGDYRVTGARNLSSQKQAVVDVDGTSNILGSQGHDVVTEVSIKDTVSPTKATNILQERPVFGETASKDSMPPESNNMSRDKSSTLDTDKSKEIAGGESVVPSSDVNTSGSFILRKSGDTGAFDEKGMQLADPVTEVTSIVKKADASTSSEPTGVQFSFALKSVDKAPLFTFSSASVGNESLHLIGAQSEGKLEAVNSSGTPTNKESLGSRSSENAENGDLFRHVTNSIASSSVAGSASVPFLDKSTGNVMCPDPSSSIATAPIVTNVNSSFSSGSIFQSGFGTSMSAAPLNSTSVKPPASGIESTNSEPKTMSTLPFSGLKSSSFGIDTSALTGSSSSSSVFGTLTTSSATFPAFDSQLQSYNNSGAASGSLPGLSGPFSAITGGALSVSSAPSAKLFETGSSPLASTPPTLFSSSTTSTSSIFDSTFSNTVFKFGASPATNAALASPQIASGSALSTSSGSVFSFASMGNMSSSPLTSSFSVPTWPNPFSAASLGNDQMNVEDSSAKPTVPASNPLFPDFGQPSSSSQQPNFVFGAPSSSGEASVFQFSSQQNPGSFESSGGGLFSVGTGGGVDKSNRRFIKARRDKLGKR